MKSDDSKLNHGFRPLFQKLDFSRIFGPIQLAIEHAHVNRTAMMGFHRQGHVMIVDEHRFVRLGRDGRRNMLGSQKQRFRFGKETGQ